MPKRQAQPIVELSQHLADAVKADLSQDITRMPKNKLLLFNTAVNRSDSFSELVLNGYQTYPVTDLDALIKQKYIYDEIVFCNSLLSSPAYKRVLIKIHKLLENDGHFISYDFLLAQDKRYTDTEVQALTDKMKYHTAIMDENVFKGKLQKYCFEEQTSENLSAKLMCKLNDRTLQHILDRERLIFIRTMCSKRKGGSYELEPRLRDENGFRRRAAAVLFKKTDSGVKILLLKRRSKGYTFPGGGIEKNEDVAEAVTRECFEECGAVCQVVERLGSVTDDVRKTITEVFIARVLEEKKEYPENHRSKKWFSREFLTENIDKIDETDFFGKNTVTTKGMLSMSWEKVKNI